MTTVQKKAVLQAAAAHVRRKCLKESSGHDWSHIERVHRHALRLAREEKADLFVVGLAALLHDIADHKFHGGDTEIGPRTAAAWMKRRRVPPETVAHVAEIIGTMSFKGGKDRPPMRTPEGKVVQDADRLDALGAIGIGRAFAYGGYAGRAIYGTEGATLDHFHEKLLLLKDRMNTRAGKKAAQKRHAFLLLYLKAFEAELAG